MHLRDLLGPPDLERPAQANPRVLRHQLDGMVHVSGLEHQEAAQLLLGLGERPIGHENLAARPSQRPGGTSALERLAGDEVAIDMAWVSSTAGSSQGSSSLA